MVYTDLDGTLLDREDYAWDEASEAVERLKSLTIPIVFCSSKTRAEQEIYQKELGIDQPCVVENGSAIIIPEDYFAAKSLPKHQNLNGKIVIELGMDADLIQTKLHRIRRQYGLDFRTYSEMTDEELASLTGLSGDQVQRARQRKFSETIDASNLTEGDWTRFRAALAKEDLVCESGGKLHTVVASSANKSRAVRILTDLYRRRDGDITTLGLGDSPNDRSMLMAVDIAFQVKRPDDTWHQLRLPDVRKVGKGPVGWQEAILNELETARNSVQ